MAELPVGRAARGKAGVFGSSINPLAVYMQYAGQRERNKAAIAAQQRAERDKAMDYLDEFNPKMKFAELNYELNNEVKRDVRDWFVNNYESSKGNPNFRNELEFRKANKLALVEEGNAWIEKIQKLETDIKADPFRYKTGEGSALSAVRDIYKNPDGTTRSINEIRETIQNADALRYDPKVLNSEGVVKKFIENLPEQNRVLLSKAYSAMGYSPDEIETMVKSGLTYEMEKDPATGQMRPALDDDLLPKVVVDEKLYRLAKSDPYMNSLMMDASASKEGQMDWLRKNVRGQGDKVIFDRQVISGKKNDDFRYSYGGGRYRTPIADLQERDKLLTQATLGTPSGEVILGYFDDPRSEIKAYRSTEDKKANKKGEFIAVDYTTSAIDLPQVSDEQYNAMNFAERKRYDEGMKNRKVVKTEYYDITSQDDRDKLKVIFSREMDKMDKTKAIGEEYPRFINDSRTMKNKSKGKKGAYNFDNAGQ